MKIFSSFSRYLLALAVGAIVGLFCSSSLKTDSFGQSLAFIAMMFLQICFIPFVVITEIISRRKLQHYILIPFIAFPLFHVCLIAYYYVMSTIPAAFAPGLVMVSLLFVFALLCLGIPIALVKLVDILREHKQDKDSSVEEEQT